MATQDKWEKQHLKSIAKYERLIKQIYDKYVQEAARIGADITSFDASNPLAFDDYPLTRKRIEALQKHMASDIEAVVYNGIDEQWALADGKTSALIATAFAGLSAEELEERKAKYLTNRDDAREAFKTRKENGINISDRVWRYTGQFKEEMEMGIDLGLRDGKSADALSRDLRKYLNNPNMLFRRVRDEHGVLHLSQRAKAYHPGQGVYRSSYKNARRLAATETNIAYRTADHDRVQDLDFVVGIRVNLSNNHTLNGKPFTDICDELSAPFGSKATKGKGCYPKDFKFTGWHPLCRCFITTILKTEEEMDADDERIMSGDEPADPSESKNYVEDVPDNFKTWSKNNAERVERAKSVPYFIRDNRGYYDGAFAPKYGAVKGTKLGRSASKEAYKEYSHSPAPTLTKEVRDNTAEIALAMGLGDPKPMTFMEANEGRSNVNYRKGGVFEENCQMSVIVHEARLRGLDVTAVGYSNDVRSVSYMLGERFQDIWVNPKNRKTPMPTELRDVSFSGMMGKLYSATKTTGRYHIGINMQDGGHVITAERLTNGNLIFYDAQNGAFINIEEYSARKVEYLEVIKVDKLLIRADWFMSIATLP